MIEAKCSASDQVAMTYHLPNMAVWSTVVSSGCYCPGAYTGAHTHKQTQRALQGVQRCWTNTVAGQDQLQS